MENALKFVKNDFWNISDDELKVRKILYTIKGIRREMNTDNPEHVALLIDLTRSKSESYTSGYTRVKGHT